MAADTGLWHLLVLASASSQWIEIGISATVFLLLFLDFGYSKSNPQIFWDHR